MSKTTTPRLCLFCNRTGKITGEDAWPLWLLNDIKDRHQHTGVEINRGSGPTRRDALGKAIVSVVCKKCNNGWMSQLEMLATPILRPLMSGQLPVPLDRTAQRVLAFWLQKTSMMLDNHIPIEHRKYLPSHYHELFTAQSPLPNSVVWIGKIVRPMLHHNSAKHDVELPGKYTSDGVIGGEPIRFRIPRTTLRVEHLVAQSIFCASGDPEVIVTGVKDPDRMQCIWPTTKDVVEIQNDGVAHNDELFQQLCDRDVPMNIVAQRT